MSESSPTPQQNSSNQTKTDPTPQFPILSQWGASIETATKAGLVLVGAAYVVGLLILNLHIRKYGVSYLGFLQIEYVMAGVLWGFLVAFTYALVVVWWHILKGAREDLKVKKFPQVLWRLLLVPFSLFAFFNLYSTTLNFLGEGQWLGYKWKVAFALVLNVLVIFNLTTNVKGVLGQIRANIGFKTFDLLYYVASLVIMLSVYTGLVFPYLSPTFGGGKPRSAVFIVKPEHTETIKAIGLQSLLQERNVGPVEVIFEASDFFLISPPPDFSNSKVRAIRINKDLFHATYYLKEGSPNVFPFFEN